MKNQDTSADKSKVILFRAGETLHGAKLDEVLKVVTEDNLTYIPRTPNHVKGAIYHEGRAIPVFLCETGKNNGESENLVLLFEHAHGPVGLAIDRVIGVVDETEVEHNEEDELLYGGERVKLVTNKDLLSPPAPDK